MAGKHDKIMQALEAAEKASRAGGSQGVGVFTEDVMRELGDIPIKEPKSRGIGRSKKIRAAKRRKVTSMLRSAMKAGLIYGYSSKAKVRNRKGGTLVKNVMIWFTKSTPIEATLDVVAEELEDRGDLDLATKVDEAADGIKPADLLEEEFEAELNRMGFTKDVLTRDEDVAEQIFIERIPHIDPTSDDSR